MSIITSLLDTDLYKITMQQAMFHQFSGACGEYKFLCRNKDTNLLPFKEEIENELDNLCNITYSEEELEYLSKIRFIKPDFIEFLKLFKLNRNHIKVSDVDGILDIRARGPLYLVSPFEIYVLAIVHEIYSRNVNKNLEALYTEGIRRLNEKMRMAFDGCVNKPFMSITDFGTRRRFNKEWHGIVLAEMIKNNFIIGTSNVMYARNYGIAPIGTVAHEFIEMFQGLGTCQLKDSQKAAFQSWCSEYRGDLGTVLSDTLGTEKFLKDFDMYFAKLFDSVRHDSGNPFKWGDKIISHYESLRIEPKTKSLIFSDGLDIPLALRLYDYFRGRIKVSFGIGTNLTNDNSTVPLQNVMKLISINGNPVAKISDNPEKTVCTNLDFLKYLKSVI